MGAGCRAHLAEPADTRALRGPKRRAKTDRADARHLRDLLRGTLPESWIPLAHVADVRAQVRLEGVNALISFRARCGSRGCGRPCRPAVAAWPTPAR